MKPAKIFGLLFINYIFWILVALGYFVIEGFHVNTIGIAFSFFYILGQTSLFFFIFYILFYLLRFVLRNFSKFAFIAILAFVNCCYVFDLAVFSQYRFHIGKAMLSLIFGPAAAEIFSVDFSMYIVTALILLGIILLTVFFGFIAAKIAFALRFIKIAVSLMILTVIGYNLMASTGRFFNIPPVVEQLSYLPLTYPLSMNRFLTKHGFKPGENDFSHLSNAKFFYPKKDLFCVAKDLPNILILAVDSLRYDVFNEEVMPKSYEFFKNGQIFENHFSGGNATAAGIFSLFYGLPRNYWDVATSSQTEPVAMTKFREFDYQFFISTSAKLTSPEFHRNVFCKVDNVRTESDGETVGQRDIDCKDDFIAMLKNRDKSRPFFGFVFLDAPHGYAYENGYKGFKPVFQPEVKGVNYATLNKNTDPTEHMNLYKNSSLFSDQVLGEIYDVLKAEGLVDNTIIMLTGDHGQEVNDTHNNFWGHNSSFTKYQTKVPFAVLWPNKQAATYDHLTHHSDVMATILTDALQCDNDIASFSIGKNLFDKSPRDYIIINSYTIQAVRDASGITTEINQFGSLKTYDDEYVKQGKPVDGSLIKKAFRDAMRFSEE